MFIYEEEISNVPGIFGLKSTRMAFGNRLVPESATLVWYDFGRSASCERPYPFMFRRFSPSQDPPDPSTSREPARRSKTSRSNGSPRRSRDGAPILFDAVTQLPPSPESDAEEPFVPSPPEDNVSGASGSNDERALGSRVMRGVSWTLAGTLWTQVLGIARTVALARLLTQADFGVAAMALTVIGGLYVLTNTSVVASVVSSRFDDEEELGRYVNLVWTMEVARGALITSLLLLLSKAFAGFYNEPKLFPMLLALSLTPVCTSLQNVGLFLKSRGVDLKSLTLHSVCSNTLGVAATIILALWTRNYWALVWGQVLGAFATTALSFVFSSYRPRLSWDKTLSKRAFDFGKHQFVIGLANYALTTMDNVAVGRLLGSGVLGIYVAAYSFCTLARTLVNSAFNTVLFPAFASAGREDDPERLRALVERAFTLGVLALTAMISPMIAFAPAILTILYGAKWSEAIFPMRLLLIAGFFAGLLSLFSAFFVGLDRAGLESKGKVWDALLFLALLGPLTIYFGVGGAALTGIIAWSGAAIWRWKWANDLAPGALMRLPYLLVSALAVSEVSCALFIAPWAGAAGGWGNAFRDPFPSLGTAWTQLLVGAPLMSAFCVFAFSLLHPIARREVASMTSKLRRKVGSR